MSVMIVSTNERELALVKEMIDTGQEMLKMNDKKRQQLQQANIPMDVNIIFKKIKEEE